MYLELSLPICAIMFSILLCYIYFSKKKVRLIENRMYSTMLVCVLFDSILVTIEKWLVAGHTINSINTTTNLLICLLNKFDACFLIMVTSCLFLYISVVTLKLDEKKFKRILYLTIFIDLFLFVLVFILHLNLIENNNIISVAGTAIYPVYFACGISILLSLIITLTHPKNITKKHIPLFCTIIIFFILMIIFTHNPYVTVISIALTFINFVMYFTIENPDLDMINKLRIAACEAEKANRAKSDFLSSMSHEIRTPLNTIVGLTNDMSDHKEEASNRLIEDINDIQYASQNLLEIVGNILDINKIENNKMEIINVPYNLREELSKLIKLIKIRNQNKPIEFVTSISENIPEELVGDKSHINTIINNLLTNAFKYTTSGKVSLILYCINTDDICELTINVKDTGKGISKGNIKKLFTKFERLDTEMNSTIEGTGLGLAITKNLVELMNGEITVQSEVGIGSTFSVKIPQKINSLINSKPLPEIDTTKVYGHKKVLIVDDNKLNLKVARKNLQDFNFTIDEAYNGEEGVKLASTKEYDLILMDIMMPIMDGETALRKLKENPKFNTPVIALTADAVAGAEEKYLSEGFSFYIAKPFNKEQIKEKLDKIF